MQLFSAVNAVNGHLFAACKLLSIGYYPPEGKRGKILKMTLPQDEEDKNKNKE